MTEITTLLGQLSDDKRQALDQLFTVLHGELKILARSRLRGHAITLTATSLVQDLYLKLVGAQSLTLHSRQHFFACCGAAMRQILVDSARASAAQKRGGDQIMVTLSELPGTSTHTDMLSLNEAMDELGQVQPELVELVHLRFFAGLSMDEIAVLTERSERSLHRDWWTARAFLGARLQS